MQFLYSQKQGGVTICVWAYLCMNKQGFAALSQFDMSPWQVVIIHYTFTYIVIVNIIADDITNFMQRSRQKIYQIKIKKYEYFNAIFIQPKARWCYDMRMGISVYFQR